MAGTQEPDTVSTKCQRIAVLAHRRPELAFTSLNHLLDHQWLRMAFLRTRQDAAPGVDGQTAQQYAEDLEGNLESLLERAKQLSSAPGAAGIPPQGGWQGHPGDWATDL
jgi:RNA-directed DNA polymerase